MNIVAVTACPTGIAHTYMAADVLSKAAIKFGVELKVETQGAMGIENILTTQDIIRADKALIVSDIEVEEASRFIHIPTVYLSIEEVLTDVDRVFLKHCRS